ncbi:hypothetical protein M4951_21490 [Blastopirellula sp. J2-11]|uniref:hypothetical protein n=1 Tax=Blastopirellula sp. J2-11 TaxID=2943192 RepID=UPI0021C80F0C|nr:hypothetical protein [Blastopirellula sp. J2-11]UUO05928.1 hypothetical protein M4951_21490 [Blastopirellula sp. J2-11]
MTVTDVEDSSLQDSPSTFRWRDRFGSPITRCMISLILLLIVSPLYWRLGAILQSYVGDAIPGDPTLSWPLAAMFFIRVWQNEFYFAWLAIVIALPIGSAVARVPLCVVAMAGIFAALVNGWMNSAYANLVNPVAAGLQILLGILSVVLLTWTMRGFARLYGGGSQFSVRTLFLVITAAAVVLGIVRFLGISHVWVSQMFSEGQLAGLAYHSARQTSISCGVAGAAAFAGTRIGSFFWWAAVPIALVGATITHLLSESYLSPTSMGSTLLYFAMLSAGLAFAILPLVWLPWRRSSANPAQSLQTAPN